MAQHWLVPLAAVLGCATLPLVAEAVGPYVPTWDSLDSRPLPAWFDQAKVGLFLHWGVFSVPSYTSEWFWWYWQGWDEPRNPNPAKFMAKNYPPGFTYPDFAKDFTCEFFDPDEWARIFQESGARYVVLTTKHHEGFTLWPSNGKTLVELRELVERYKPEIIWSDGDPAPAEYWKSREFLAWLYNDSPVRDTVVTNDRWCNGCSCKHGGYFTCYDRVLQPRKWENCMTLDRQSWGYRRDATLADVLSIQELIETLVQSISCGGNILINVGPTRDGRLELIYQERLQQLGRWLKVNGEGVYGSAAWTCQNDTATGKVWYTQGVTKDGEKAVYVFILEWPSQSVLHLASLRLGAGSRVVLLGAEEEPVTVVEQSTLRLTLALPNLTMDRLPTPWAWVLRVTGPATGYCPTRLSVNSIL
ncbi:hypothetical protein HPB52_014566 [Rhipicephalus sanguineus]|uniref:alpha-L-fucosidase n=1 Tax=Rhipicephalus sanguineus TaxID=34632 RepID=A0A9D4YQ73_RHISA|nr:hypothetical protein HPB52_014566 [Rhipicephalus sanguineus]